MCTAGCEVAAAEAASPGRGLIDVRFILVWHLQPLWQPFQQLKERLGAWRLRSLRKGLSSA
jgi:hypothetical protein